MSASTIAPAVIEVTPLLLIPMSPVTAAAVGTFVLLPSRIWADARFSSFVKVIAAFEATSPFAIVPSAIIVEVTVPVSPVVTTVPEISGKLMVRSAVGSTTPIVVSAVLSVAPSKTRVPVSLISSSPVIVPPALGSFSVSSSVSAVCTFIDARLPCGV